MYRNKFKGLKQCVSEFISYKKINKLQVLLAPQAKTLSLLFRNSSKLLKLRWHQKLTSLS